MLHLVYRFKPTAKARSNMEAFWEWIADRQLWFYAGLDMVLATRWNTVTIGPDVHCLEHAVTFADEAAWGRYRDELKKRSRNPEFESRRTSQDEWYEILDARLLTDPPFDIPLPSQNEEDSTLAGRSYRLLTQSQFVTLATSGEAGAWSSPVNFLPRFDPLRLFWYSLRTAQHSRNIASQPSISGSIFRTGLKEDQGPSGLPIDGAQFTGTCREVTPAELENYHRHYYEQNFPDPTVRKEWLIPQDQFCDEGPWRFYVLEIDRWWLYDAERWVQDKHDTRIEVPVETITSSAAEPEVG